MCLGTSRNILDVHLQLLSMEFEGSCTMCVHSDGQAPRKHPCILGACCTMLQQSSEQQHSCLLLDCTQCQGLSCKCWLPLSQGPAPIST